jgi:hypothetical protein
VPVYLLSVVVVAMLTFQAASAVLDAIHFAHVTKAQEPIRTEAPVTEHRVAEDSFTDMLKSESFWQRRRSSSSAGKRSKPSSFERPSRLGRRPQEEAGFDLFSPWTFGFDGSNSDEDNEGERTPRVSNRFRTMCVRLCDGYYWPVSFAADESRFAADASACSNSCTSPAKLYVYRNPGQEIAEMRDLSGNSYSKLRTAFLYRTSYDANCKCRPHAWEQASLDRHRLYALQSKRRNGNRKAAAELKELRRKVRDSKREERRARDRLKRAQRRGWTVVSESALPPMQLRRAPAVAAVKSGAGIAPVAGAVLTNSTSVDPAGDVSPIATPAGLYSPHFRRITPAAVRTGTASVTRPPVVVQLQPPRERELAEPIAPASSPALSEGRMSLGVRRTTVRQQKKQSRPAASRPRPADDWRRRVFQAD